MNRFTPLALATLLAAAAAAPAFRPRTCDAQEKSAPAARIDRIHDVSAVMGPRLPSDLTEHVTAPFGISTATLENEGEPEVALREPAMGQSILEELIRNALAPQVAEDTEITWVWNGGGLRVRSTAEGQRQVEAALDQIRRAVGPPTELTLRALSLAPGAASDALVAELERLGTAPVPQALVDRLVAADVRGGLRGGSASSFAGALTPLDRVTSRTFAANWDVEIAQAASIADPVPARVEEGLRAQLRSTPMLGDRVLVSLSAATGDVQSPVRRVEMRTKDLGVAEMPEVRGGYVATEWLARPGETTAVVLASPVSPGAGVREVLLVTRGASPARDESGAFALLPVGALCREDVEPHLRCGPTGPAGSNVVGFLEVSAKESGRRLDVENLAQVVSEAAAQVTSHDGNAVSANTEWPGGGVLAVVGERAYREKARATIAGVEADVLRPARVTVRLVAREGAGAEDRTLGVVAGPALAGRTVALAAYTTVPFVGDYDVEVAQEARIADPIVCAAMGGLVLNVRLAPDGAEGWQADIDLTASSVAPVENAPVAATEVGVIERIPVRRARARQAVALQNGKPKEIDLGANPWGAGRLVAILRVER